MKLEWMGRNREFIRLLVKFVNLFSHNGSKSVSNRSGISVNAHQWQTLECIIEYEDENCNMVFLAKQLGLPKSTFSKHVNFLEKEGLVERYQRSDNQKDIIMKPSSKGMVFYLERSRIILEAAWKGPFSILDKLSEENLAVFVDFMSSMVADIEQENNKAIELFKL